MAALLLLYLCTQQVQARAQLPPLAPSQVELSAQILRLPGLYYAPDWPPCQRSFPWPGAQVHLGTVWEPFHYCTAL